MLACVVCEQTEHFLAFNSCWCTWMSFKKLEHCML